MSKAAARALLAILLVVVGYLALARFFPPDHILSRTRQALRAQEAGQPVDIGILWLDNPEDGFRLGAQLALDKANEGGGMQLPDGTRRQLSARFIKLETHDLGRDSYARRLSREFGWDSGVVAVVGENGSRQARLGSVLFERYGIAFLSTETATGGSSFTKLRYSIDLRPPFREYSRKVNRTLPDMVDGDGDISVGVFFNAEYPEVAAMLQIYREDVQEQNTIVEAAGELRKAIARGTMKPDTKLARLVGNRFLDAGVLSDPAALNTFLTECFTQDQLDSGLTVEQGLEQCGAPTRTINLAFIRAFVPPPQKRASVDYRPIISAAGTDAVDAVVIVSDLPRTGPFLADLERMQVPGHVICFDTEDSVALESLVGPTMDLHVASLQDPQSRDPAYLEFDRDFRALATREGRGSPEPDEMGLLGFQSVDLLRQAIEQSGRSIPLELITTLETTAEWTTAGSSFSIDSGGYSVGREIFLLRFRNGTLVNVDQEQ